MNAGQPVPVELCCRAVSRNVSMLPAMTAYRAVFSGSCRWYLAGSGAAAAPGSRSNANGGNDGAG